MRPLYAVTKRMPHHRGHAGYNQLLAHVAPDELVFAPSGPPWRLAGALSRRLLKPLTGTAWYGAPSLAAELGLLAKLRDAPPGILHVMYGEDLLLLLPRLQRRHKVVATFHQPPERFDRLVSRSWVFSSLDAAIVLDERNADAWAQRLGAARVHRATLGVDLDYWHPGDTDEGYVLTVGSHLRDFDVLEGVIGRLPDVRFELVIPRDAARRFAGQPGVVCRRDVSDETLARLYRRASALFLPLRGGSASNTLLQALASGLPVVTSDYAGVRTYLDRDMARFAPVGDAAAHADALKRVLDGDRKRMAKAARERAARFSWPAIAQRHYEIYEEIGGS